MTERLRSASTSGYQNPNVKMENDLSPRKTMLVLVIVVGCFAVLWPKVFYPMLVGSANQHIKPSPIDKTTGCCDVISETDINTIKIMSELCGTIIKSSNEEKPLTGKEIVNRCKQEILDTCGIDISVVLQEQVRLGQSVKHILDEIRSLNGSLCLKYNYGVAPWRLGVPHRITVKMAPGISNIRQERPLHLRSELIHPAFRERGRAIPHPQTSPPSTRPPPRVVEGRPGPLPGMRPTMGGAGHVVPPSKQGTSSMSVIMPIYTIGIVIFFTYTLMKIIFKKQPEGVGGSLYPPVDPDPHFRKEVFESESSRLGPRLSRESISNKLGDAELDQLRQRLRETELAMERIVEQMSKVPLKAQDLVNGTLSNGAAVKPHDNEEQPTVKVLGMEMTASCEGGKKWSRPDSPVLPTSPPPPPAEPVPPPQEIYLEGALPPQSQLLVADSATEPQPNAGEDPAVVLAGKMTLSVISLDSENGVDEEGELSCEQVLLKGGETVPVVESEEQIKEVEELLSGEIKSKEPKLSSDFEQIEELLEDTQEKLKQQVEDVHESMVELKEQIEEQTRAFVTNVQETPIVTEEIQKTVTESKDLQSPIEELREDSLPKPPSKLEENIQMPMIVLERPENIFDTKQGLSQTVAVEEVEREVDNLIQEALATIEQRESINIAILQKLNQETNEINDNLSEKEEIQKQKEILSETIEGQPILQNLNNVLESEGLIEAEKKEILNLEQGPTEKTETEEIVQSTSEEEKILREIEEAMKVDDQDIMISNKKGFEIPISENILQTKEISNVEQKFVEKVEEPLVKVDEKIKGDEVKEYKSSEKIEDKKEPSMKHDEIEQPVEIKEISTVENKPSEKVEEPLMKMDDGIVSSSKSDVVLTEEHKSSEEVEELKHVDDKSIKSNEANNLIERKEFPVKEQKSPEKVEEPLMKIEEKNFPSSEGDKIIPVEHKTSEEIEESKNIDDKNEPNIKSGQMENLTETKEILNVEQIPADKIEELLIKNDEKVISSSKDDEVVTGVNEELKKSFDEKEPSMQSDQMESLIETKEVSKVKQEPPQKLEDEPSKKVEDSKKIVKEKPANKVDEIENLIEPKEIATLEQKPIEKIEEQKETNNKEEPSTKNIEIEDISEGSIQIKDIPIVDQKSTEKIGETIKIEEIVQPSSSSSNVEKSEENTNLMKTKEIPSSVEQNQPEKNIEQFIAKESSKNVEISEKVDSVEVNNKVIGALEEVVEKNKIESDLAIPVSKTVEEPKDAVDIKPSSAQIASSEETKSEEMKKINAEEITTTSETEDDENKLISKDKDVEKLEEKTKHNEPIEIFSDDDELGSDEEMVEEIEEIVYESDEEESDEEEEENANEPDINIAGAGAVQRVNGERSEDLVEESKYTTVSGTTAAENDISDEELTDEEEIIEVEEEVEDEDYIVEESNDVNNISEESDIEL